MQAPVRPRRGEHRRDPDGGERDLRWHWLALFCLLPVLAVAGVIWLLTSLPHPVSVREAPPAGQSDSLSAPGTTLTTEPAPTRTVDSTVTPTGTTTPFVSTSASPTPVASPTPARSPTAKATRSPTPSLVAVPDVVGRPRQAAESTLRSAGFEVAVVNVPPDGRRRANRVTSQSPSGGTTARTGTTVTIYVPLA